jgi:uncharacterized flavoprotein (TIGR03862 family)
VEQKDLIGTKDKIITIIGGGPAGMIAAERLTTAGYTVHLYDAKPAVLRKFLVAGKGGLNLTREEAFESFLSKYGQHAHRLEPYLQKFGPADIVDWSHQLGFSTFTGSSNKVFPEKMDAVELRRAWIDRLKSLGVQFFLNHRWLGWDINNNLVFNTQKGNITHSSDAVILALGGASWPKTGSDGSWFEILTKEGILVKSFKPANCGFEVGWSEHFREKFAGTSIKPVILHFAPKDGEPNQQRGEFIITSYGVEGSLIYAFSAQIREEISKNQVATIYLDLAPEWSQQKLENRLARPRGSRSLATHINKSIGLHGAKMGLLWEFVPKTIIGDPGQLAKNIKSLPLPLLAPRPIEEAISTAGGVSFTELNADLMLSKKPGVFCAGEMLDWEAPTGGYLLTACISTRVAAANGVRKYFQHQE